METTMTLTGNVGHTLELKQTRTGIATVTFRVGTTPRVRTETGWTDGATTWMSVVCYRGLADHVARSIKKGDPVLVHGRVRTQEWIDPQGVLHDRMVIEASAVGHDLTRGVSVFARASGRPTEEPPAEPEPSVPDSEPSAPDSVCISDEELSAQVFGTEDTRSPDPDELPDVLDDREPALAAV